MTYGRSTYAQLIDVLLSDIDDVRLKKITPSSWMDAILRAEERICRLTTVREEYTLRYSTTVTDYPLLNRPAITGATNATPIVLTAIAHGIPNHVRVFIVGSQGNDAANGMWFTSDVAADALTINPGAYISKVEISASGVATVTTETAHGFSDGATVTINGINAQIPDGDYVMTLLTTTTFSLAGPFAVADYPGAGVVYQKSASTGNGVYAGGGRISRDNELPAYFSKFLAAHGLYSGLHFDVLGYQKDDLDSSRSRYPYTHNPPSAGAIYRSGGRKYLRIDPPPMSDGDVTITAEVQIIPVECYGETEDLEVHLTSEFDPMILAYMKSRAFEKLGDVKMMRFWGDSFIEAVKEHNANEPVRHIQVDSR